MKRVLVICVVMAACGSGSGKKTGGSGGGAGGSGGSGGGTNGDAGVNASCGSATACGGNIVGTWRFAASCGAAQNVACTAPHTIASTTTYSGTMTYSFNSGGVFTYTASTGTVTQLARYPIDCLGAVTDAGTPDACAVLQDLFLKAIQQSDGGSSVFSSATCAAEGNEACVCNLGVALTEQRTASGSYTTNGNQVIITVTSASWDGGVGDGGESWDYCVSGNALTIHATVTGGDVVETFNKQ